MTPGEQVLAALQAQGFGVAPDGEDYVIITRDGRRQHSVPAARFHGHTAADLAGLRIIVTGLELLEGFTPPAEFWDW